MRKLVGEIRKSDRWRSVILLVWALSLDSDTCTQGWESLLGLIEYHQLVSKRNLTTEINMLDTSDSFFIGTYCFTSN